MAKDSKPFYRQCTLEKTQGESLVSTQTWLPEKFAKIGRILDIQDSDTKEWTRDWRVKAASQTRTDNPPDWRKLVRNHRRQTGDSMAKTH